MLLLITWYSINKICGCSKKESSFFLRSPSLLPPAHKGLVKRNRTQVPQLGRLRGTSFIGTRKYIRTLQRERKFCLLELRTKWVTNHVWNHIGCILIIFNTMFYLAESKIAYSLAQLFSLKLYDTFINLVALAISWLYFTFLWNN
jgi:hypothetical protein